MMPSVSSPCFIDHSHSPFAAFCEFGLYKWHYYYYYYYYFCQFTAQSIDSFSKYRVHKIGNRQAIGRTGREDYISGQSRLAQAYKSEKGNFRVQTVQTDRQTDGQTDVNVLTTLTILTIV